LRPGTPGGKLLVVELIGHIRVPFGAHRADHHARIKLAAIDPHRAAEAVADLEGGFDDGVASEARRYRLEIGDFPGRCGGPFRSSSGQVQGATC